MNFILFNGPPRSGKDTAAKFVHDYLVMKDFEATRRNKVVPYPIWEKFSFPNKWAFAAMVGKSCDRWGNVPGYEERKEEILPWLGVSYRQWQIDFSEKFMKRAYGEDIFGRLLVRRCTSRQDAIHIVSDCGFQIEVDCVCSHNYLLFNVVRDGTSFDGDSREWVIGRRANPSINLDNNGSLADLEKQVVERVSDWVEETIR